MGIGFDKFVGKEIPVDIDSNWKFWNELWDVENEGATSKLEIALLVMLFDFICDGSKQCLDNVISAQWNE